MDVRVLVDPISKCKGLIVYGAGAQFTDTTGHPDLDGKIEPVEDLSYGQIGLFHCSLFT